MSFEEFQGSRKRLEDYIRQKPFRTIELAAYDVMFQAVLEYEFRLSERMGEFIDTALAMGIKYKQVALRDFNSILSEFGHRPAYIFVIGYDPSNEEHSRRVFKPHVDRLCVGSTLSHQDSQVDLQQIAYEDGAIIVDTHGLITCTNAQLVNVNPAEIPHVGDRNPHDAIGFKTPVNTRHFASAGASYHLPETIVYSLGELGHIRRYEAGKISFSTVADEG